MARSNPKDEEFFRRAATELQLEHSQLVALGRLADRRVESTKIKHCLPLSKPRLQQCIVGKSWDYHVTEALRQPLDEGVAMVGDL